MPVVSRVRSAVSKMGGFHALSARRPVSPAGRPVRPDKRSGVAVWRRGTTALAALATAAISASLLLSDTATVADGTDAPGVTGVGSTTAYSATATTAVALAKPSGTTAGDVLVVSITADLDPALVSVPSGWVPIVNALLINSSSSSGARVFAYWHAVGPSDPASYAWTLSKDVMWGAGVTAYRGVNNATPLDGAVATAVNTSYKATSITVPGITTASNGAMLIGGVGFDSRDPAASPPNGWAEQWEAAGGQIAEQADMTQAAAGASGDAIWTFNTAKAVAAWRTALKPAR